MRVLLCKDWSESMPTLTTEELYETLLEHMGPQHWWPAESSEEMMLGAILVQNTNWKNADMALLRLKEKQTLILKKFYRCH